MAARRTVSIKLSEKDLDCVRCAVYDALMGWRVIAAKEHAERGPGRCWTDSIVEHHHRLYDRLLKMTIV